MIGSWCAIGLGATVSSASLSLSPFVSLLLSSAGFRVCCSALLTYDMRVVRARLLFFLFYVFFASLFLQYFHHIFLFLLPCACACVCVCALCFFLCAVSRQTTKPVGVRSVCL